MNREELFSIRPEGPDNRIFNIIKDSFDSIAKPLDGFGDFETLLSKIGAIQGKTDPDTGKRAAVIFCGDNGIVEEGVSQSGKEVTLSVALALGKGISTACTLGRACNTDIIPVDIGIDSDERIEGVLNRKVSRGTADFLKERAMREDQALKAVSVGIELARELKERGYGILAAGEMGIGNTTTSAAVLSALLNIDSDKVTGRGAGLDDRAFIRKKEVIRKALQKYDIDSADDPAERAFEILLSFGGLDMAGIIGLIAGGAIHHVPVVLDGLITAVSALLAETMIPGVKEYLIASHRGREEGTGIALERLGLKPLLEGDMALGEGTGAIMLFPLMDVMADLLKNAGRFEDYDMDRYKRF